MKAIEMAKERLSKRVNVILRNENWSKREGYSTELRPTVAVCGRRCSSFGRVGERDCWFDELNMTRNAKRRYHTNNK